MWHTLVPCLATSTVENANRVPPAYIICAGGRRFVFATATVQGHQLRGEERFAVEWHKDDDSVWWGSFKDLNSILKG